MVGISPIVKQERKGRILRLVSNGYTLTEISKIEKLAMDTVCDYAKEIAKEAKQFIDTSIKEGTSQILVLTLANVTDIINRADKMMETSNDERTKLMCMKTILEAAKLRNETVMSGFNHVALKESNDMLEKVNKMTQEGPSEKSLSQTPNFMPKIEIHESPEQRKVDVEGVLPNKEDREPTEEPQEEEKPIEITTRGQKLRKTLNLSKHVTTNAFNRMDTEEIMQ